MLGVAPSPKALYLAHEGVWRVLADMTGLRTVDIRKEFKLNGPDLLLGKIREEMGIEQFEMLIMLSDELDTEFPSEFLSPAEVFFEMTAQQLVEHVAQYLPQ